MPDLEILRPKIFQNTPSVVAACSTRIGGVSPEPLGLNMSFNVGDDRAHVIRNRELFFGRLHIGLDELAIPMQCHRTAVLRARYPGGFESCDGLVTCELGLYLVVSVADCVPVLIYDPVRRAAGALHAGWRGTAGGMMKSGLDAMKKEFGTQPADIIAWIGPAAGVCCYEVDEETAKQFPDEVVDRSGNKPRVDLKRANRNQLVTHGVREKSIEVHTSCTIHESEMFHSHRRDGSTAGRMMAVIGIVR
jgi:polyphenol oxidase